MYSSSIVHRSQHEMQHATRGARHASNSQAAVIQDTEPFLHTLHEHTHSKKAGEKKQKSKSKM